MGQVPSLPPTYTHRSRGRSGCIPYCRGLKGSPPQAGSLSSLSRICDCGLIWEKGLCGCAEVQDPLMSLSVWALHPRASMQIRRPTNREKQRLFLGSPNGAGGQHLCLQLASLMGRWSGRASCRKGGLGDPDGTAGVGKWRWLTGAGAPT